MTSQSNSVNTSKAIVPYNPNLPHISIKSYLESLTDTVFRRSFELAKFEAKSLSPLGQNWKERIITGIAYGVNYLYIDKTLGEKMARLIMRNFRNGNYDSSANPLSFKQSILNDLKSVCPDKHLDLVCSTDSISEHDPERSLTTLRPEDLTIEQTKYVKSMNAGRPDFSREIEAYIIPGTQIGYFKINLFPSPDYPETLGIIDNAMKHIVNAEALIIDLRENTGGNPATVAFVASYLFDKRELLNQVYKRSDNNLTSFYAEPEKLDKVFGGQKPIYVLTSERTFSAAEELAYDLQASKRAKIIGQTTAGGAHPVRAFIIDDLFFVVVPYAKAINPHTGSNWEGTGVKPDYPISENENAVEVARALLK